MKKIDNATVQRILDAADIVEVVSDFVALKRRGANFVGLCPFHNDRSPSFYVSKAKGMCKCFSCGEGGSPVSFIMKLEQMSFTEALHYLAKKYNIEIEEREMTDAELKAEGDRDNMLALNDFAMRYFEKTLKDTSDGRDIGLSYFRYRGLSDAMIERFHLGYALDERDAFYRKATERGFSEQYILSTGLCTKTEDGRIFDRFRGRVIYPIFTISGKVVAFGGRTLSKEKKVAKYVNSPESEIYLKRRELYGLFQAKQAISKAGKCILVEGYMDVISMHQAGVCNVVASSGTALTIEQVRLIKRFTNDVTLIYDSDAAGIKASLRGIELLLQEGVNIKVLLLPEGEDPDSFAQTHSSSEVEEYLKANEADFVSFMARILLKDAGDDPTARAAVISRVVKTIALIPNEITRSVYAQECSRLFFIDENVLRREIGKQFNEFALKSREDKMRSESLTDVHSGDTDLKPSADNGETSEQEVATDVNHSRFLRKYEEGVAQLVVRYGNYTFALDEEANPVTVIDYILSDLRADGIKFVNSDLAHLLVTAEELSTASWDADCSAATARLEEARKAEINDGIEEIRRTASDMGTISAMEKTLEERAEMNFRIALEEFSSGYLGRLLCSSPDDVLRNLATDMVVEKHILSKVHTKFSKIDSERDLLADLLPRTLNELKDAILWTQILDKKAEVAKCGNDYQKAISLMKEIRDLDLARAELAKLIGDRVIAPRK